jgi:L-ascorbate metabolism protein UlaG (beta-lactamase superfamily)
MLIRIIGGGVALVALVVGVGLWYLVSTYEVAPVDPAWAIPGSATIPDNAVTVRFTGTSTLLVSDGETDWMVDGWFTRIRPLALALGEIEPDVDAIEHGLLRNEVDTLAVVIPIHSHFDHAMDAPEVARRTGALLLGSESTANIGRGWGLDESQIRVAIDGEPVQVGRFTIRLIETNHFEFPNPVMRERALGRPRIEAPLVPPVGAFEYRVGQPYAIHVTHPLGRFLIQGSAGYRIDGFEGYAADVVFLGVGGLGTQTQEYGDAYWRETVDRVGAKRVIAIHWDSLTGPIEGPFTGSVRAVSFFSGESDDTLTFLRGKLQANPGLTLTTLPRYDEVVIFPEQPR